MKRISQIDQAVKKSETVGFRLDDESRQVLEERAKLYEVSPHVLARQYVLESLLANQERQQLWEAVKALREEIRELRKSHARGIQVLLVSGGKVEPKVAEKYVAENFNV
jgi:hypothetical protein